MATEISLTGTLDGKDLALNGTLDAPAARRGLLATLNQPFVLWLFSGLGLTLLSKCYDDRRAIRDANAATERADAQTRAARIAAQAERRVSDVRLVREMLPELARTDAEGIAAKGMLAYLGTELGTDRKLVDVVTVALTRTATDAKGSARAAQVDATATALLERPPAVSTVLPAPVRPGVPPFSAAPGTAGRTLLPAVVLPTRVYVQIAATTDRPAAELLRERFREAGLGAPGIELVRADRFSRAADDVRYFRADDRAQADAVAAIVARARPDEPPANVRLIPGFDRPGTRNLIELWLRPRA